MEKMLLAITVILLGLSVLVSGDAAAELPQKTIMGVGKSSEISITIGQDGHVSGYLTVQSEGKDDLRLLIDTTRSKALKDDRFIILDKQNEILILGKIVGDDKYLLKTRIKLDSDNKINLRHLADVEPSLTGNKDGSQRDLTSEMEQLQNKQEEVDLEKLSFQERQALELKSKVEEEARLFQEKVEKLNQKSKQDKLTHKEQLMQEALKAIQEKQRQNSENANAEEPEEPASGAELSEGKDISIVLRSPHSGYWNHDYEFSLKVYDPKINRYSDFEFRSGKIADVAIVGKIVNPRGTTLDTIRGTTTSEGYFEHSFGIPYLALAHGAYSIELTATKTYSDGTYSEDTIIESFYVRDGTDFDTNHKPIALIEFIDDSTSPARMLLATGDECVMEDGTRTDECIMIERTTENQMQIILDTLKMEYATESNITFDPDTITLDSSNMFESAPVKGLYDEVFQVGCPVRPPPLPMCPVTACTGMNEDGMACMCEDDQPLPMCPVMMDDNGDMVCTGMDENDMACMCPNATPLPMCPVMACTGMDENDMACMCPNAPPPPDVLPGPDHCKLDEMERTPLRLQPAVGDNEPHNDCWMSDDDTHEARIPETTLGQVACLLEQAGSNIIRDITKGDGQIYLGFAEIPQSSTMLEWDGSKSSDPDLDIISYIWTHNDCTVHYDDDGYVNITEPGLTTFRMDVDNENVRDSDSHERQHKNPYAEITYGPPVDTHEFCVDLVINDRKLDSDPARVEITVYNGTIHHGRG